MSDEVLIQKLLDGDDAASSHMIRTYGKLLWVIVGGILGKVGNRHDIEECVSDVYVQLWMNPKAFNPEKGSLKTYLAVIAKSKALNAYRKLSKSKAAELDDAAGLSDDDLLGSVLKNEMHDELYAAIVSLNEPDKEILLRRYFFDEKPSAIAEHISIPLKEVKNRLYRSKLRLRKTLLGTGGYGND